MSLRKLGLGLESPSLLGQCGLHMMEGVDTNLFAGLGEIDLSIDLHAAAAGEITIRIPLGARPAAGSIRLVTTTRRPVMVDSVGLLRTS